jgi:hypothetical protein
MSYTLACIHTYAEIAGGKPRKETELPEKDIL